MGNLRWFEPLLTKLFQTMNLKNVALLSLLSFFSSEACSQTNGQRDETLRFSTFSSSIQDLWQHGFDSSRDTLVAYSEIGLNSEILQFYHVKNFVFLSTDEPLESQMLNLSHSHCYVIQDEILQNEEDVWLLKMNVYLIEDSVVKLCKSKTEEVTFLGDNDILTRVIWSSE